MDIYILRDGKETGPFSEDATQGLLKRGEVLIADLAWRPGMPEWLPLHSVLYPGPATAHSRSAVGPVATALTELRNDTRGEPATAKQKAFLSYMGVPFPAELTKEQAALLVNDTMENPKDPGRVTRWNEERLRLHPELFKAEIQARKESRAAHFYEVAQTQGAECFDKVARAHCQVLVGYLDVQYPNWDANEHDATWCYFFPAIAEKFPQLVKKEWKGRLKYPDGPKVAPELTRRAVPARPTQNPKRSPFAAAARGIVVGISILVVLYAGQQFLAKRGSRQSSNSRVEPAKSNADGLVDSAKSGVSDAELEKLFSQMPTAAPPAQPSASPESSSGMPPLAGSASAATTGGLGAPPPTAEMTPATSAAPSDALTPPPPFTPASTEPTVAQPRTTLTVTKGTEVQLRFGRAKLLPGTVVRFVGQDGASLRVRYGNDIVTLPASSTDLGDIPTPAASGSAVAPTPSAPPSAAPTPAAPPAPVSDPTSLF